MMQSGRLFRAASKRALGAPSVSVSERSLDIRQAPVMFADGRAARKEARAPANRGRGARELNDNEAAAAAAAAVE